MTFSAGIASVFTGLIFTLMITRSLSPTEFGTWGLITSVIAYLLISESLISYWNVRQIARGDPVGRTSLYSAPFLLIAVIPIETSIFKDSQINIVEADFLQHLY